MIFPTEDTPQAAIEVPASIPSVLPQDTSVPVEELSLPSYLNPLGSTNRDYINMEIPLRPWWRVRQYEWTDTRFILMASIIRFEPFMTFCREIAVSLERNRGLFIEHIPCSDTEHWFSVVISWTSKEEMQAAEQALSNAFWMMPI